MYGPPPPYVMLNDGNYQPPPHHRNVPRYYNQNRKRSSGCRCCIRCICCCYCCLFLLVCILAGIAFYLYAIFEPRVPSYKVQALEVKAFDMQPDFSLNTEFLVTVIAENPNKKIGFIYGRDSSVNVIYTDTSLCSGKLPHFHQGHDNITLMKVDLKGKSEFGSGLQQALREHKEIGMIPLLVKVKVPINVVLGDFTLREFIVFVNCSLVIDNLAPNRKVDIITSRTTFAVEF